MTISMYEASAPLFRNGLTSLSAILDKAAAQCAERGLDPATLLAARLAPDMFPFTRQVQIAGDFGKNTLARLAGREAPKFEDGETSLPELKDRLARTLAFIETVPRAEVDGSEERTITLPLGQQTMTFKGQGYLTGFALPNFYFHLTTAYALLRHHGIEIGKRDFIGSLPTA